MAKKLFPGDGDTDFFLEAFENSPPLSYDGVARVQGQPALSSIMSLPLNARIERICRGLAISVEEFNFSTHWQKKFKAYLGSEGSLQLNGCKDGQFSLFDYNNNVLPAKAQALKGGDRG